MKITKNNPAFLSPEERAQRFGGRKLDLDLLLRTVRENTQRRSNQHVLVIGPRGSGKTTLLLRVADMIRGDEVLSQAWFPIATSEEIYRVGNVAEFWLEILFHLHRATGESRIERAYTNLKGERDDHRLGVAALGQILDFADRTSRRLVLIVENLDMLLEQQFSDADAWALRETLIGEPRIMLLASAVSSFDQVEKSNAPLFEQFLIHRLDPLDTDGCLQLWRAVTGEDIPRKRMRAIEILTGGNARLIVILADFAGRLSLRELMADLVDLIDHHTDYLKATTESLPALERKIFVTLAEIWEEASAARVAKESRLEVNVVSAQLARLEKRGAVISRRWGRGKRYRLAERLYNIYHLMRRRGGPEARAKAAVEFMAIHYEDGALLDRLHALADEALTLAPGERREHFLVINALLEQARRSEMRMQLISALPREIAECPDIMKSLRDSMCATSADGEKQQFQISDEELLRMPLQEIGRVDLLVRRSDLLHTATEKAEVLESAIRIQPDCAPAWLRLGSARRDLGQWEEARTAIEEAVKDYRILAEKDSEKYLPGLAMSLNGLGTILSKLVERQGALQATQEALAISRTLAEQNPDAFLPDVAMTLNNLGVSLSELADYEGARKQIEEAVDIRRQLVGKEPAIYLRSLLQNLLSLAQIRARLGFPQESQAAAQEVLKYEPDNVLALAYLCELGIRTKSMDDAIEKLHVLVGKDDDREQRIAATVKVVKLFAAQGKAKEVLAVIETSALAMFVEPLIVALKMHLGMEFTAPLEIENVAADIWKEIQALETATAKTPKS